MADIRQSIPDDETRLVLVIDDDASLRAALSSLLRSAGFDVEVFASAAEFAHKEPPAVPSCLLLDVRLQGSSGLDFQAELVRKNSRLPIVFISAHGDVPMSVKAMKAGALDFLPKPFRDQDLLDAVTLAIEGDRKRRRHDRITSELSSRFETLTPREREIMGLAAAGLMNKQIAAHVGTSEITVKIHRGNAMKKMQAKTFADLVRMAQALGMAAGDR